MIKWLCRHFDVKHHQDDYAVCCPFCQDDDGFHLYVNKHRPVAHCFRCDWRGNYISLIMAVDVCSYVDALVHIKNPVTDIKLYDSAGVDTAPDDMHSRPPGFIYLRETVALEGKIVRAYLYKRKVPLRLVNKYFGIVPGTNRVWILIDKNWWQGRLIISGEPKYISPAWQRGDSLWNYEALTACRDVVVCEGVFSAIAVGDNAVALCSKQMSDAQAQRIANAYPDSIMIMLDYGAEDEAYEVADMLSYVGYGGSISIQYMLCGDPADGVMSHVTDASWASKVEYMLSKS